MVEQLQNFGLTTLNGAIDASTTTVDVADGSVFPASGNYRLLVDDEIMLVTSRTANALTVTRGAESTTAAIHASNSDARAVLTAASLPLIIEEHGFTAVTANGIQYPATQVASANANNLDDYEEGTWTPTFGFSSAGDESWAYTTQTGRYTRIGDTVVCFVYIAVSSMTFATATGNLYLKGLPFTCAGSDAYGGGDMALSHIANYANVSAVPVGATTSARFALVTTTAHAFAGVAQITTTETPVLRGILVYHV